MSDQNNEVLTVGSIDLGDLLPVKPNTVTLVRPAGSCRECSYSHMEGKDRVCRFNPPQVTFIAAPDQQVQQTPQGPRVVQVVALRNFTGFPIVQNEQWCGQFAAKVRSRDR